MSLFDVPPRNFRTVRLAALALLLPVTASMAAAQTAKDPCEKVAKPGRKMPTKPGSDVLVFANGDQLTGTLEKGEGECITFQSDMTGEITIPLAKIKELRTGGSFALLRNDTKSPTANAPIGPLSYEGKDLTVAAPAGRERVPAASVGYLVDRTTYENEVMHPRRGIKALAHGWRGSVMGGVTLVRSTQNDTTFTAATALMRTNPAVLYLPPRDRTLFGLTETYGKLTQPAIPQTSPPTLASTTMTNIFHAGLEQDRYITPRVYLLGSMAFDHNYSQGLDLQQVYGGGIGWTVIKDEVQELDLRAQLQYVRQSFQISSYNQNLIGATIGESYMRDLPRDIVFTETVNVLPAFNNADAYSANATAGLVMPVWKQFNASFTAADQFLNNPAPGFKKNSFQFVMGVSYTLP